MACFKSIFIALCCVFIFSISKYIGHLTAIATILNVKISSVKSSRPNSTTIIEIKNIQQQFDCSKISNQTKLHSVRKSGKCNCFYIR